MYLFMYLCINLFVYVFICLLIFLCWFVRLLVCSFIHLCSLLNHVQLCTPYSLTGSINRVPTCPVGVKVTSVGWQITLCDPIDKWRPVVLKWISRRTIRSFTFFYLLYLRSIAAGEVCCPSHVQQLRRLVLRSGRTTSVEHVTTQLKTVW